MDLTALHRLTSHIVALPGVTEFSVGSTNDRNTWAATFAADATAEQIAVVRETIAAFNPEAPSDGDIRAEYERRLFAALGARDLAHAAFIRADNDIERRALSRVSGRNDEQNTRLAELQAVSSAVDKLIDAYNAMPESPPLDFADDKYWP